MRDHFQSALEDAHVQLLEIPAPALFHVIWRDQFDFRANHVFAPYRDIGG